MPGKQTMACKANAEKQEKQHVKTPFVQNAPNRGVFGEEMEKKRRGQD
jgi:hypothetical protein